MRYYLPLQRAYVRILISTSKKAAKLKLLRNRHQISKKTFLQFASYLIFASSVLAVAPSYSASAASAYDNAYQQTENLEIRGIGYGQNCSTQNVTSSWAGRILADSSVGSSFATALDSGAWAVAQTKSDNGAGIYDDYVRIYWTESAEMELDFINMFSTFNETRLVKIESEEPVHQAIIRSNFAGYVGSQNCNIIIMDAGTSNDVQFTHNFTMAQAAAEIRGYLGVNVTVNYPVDYEGDLVADGTADTDGDGLSIAKEAAQDTSDNNEDTDTDGLSDLTESKWFEDRDDVFCDASTPKNCAYPNPAKKDIYVEIDWMNDTSTSTLYKPTNTQLGLVVDMFSSEGIEVHFDTGNYGGGNELADYESALRQDSVVSIPDFEDYKVGGDGINRNFAANRQGIWRYMIYGNQYSQASGTTTSSGWAEVLGDDLFIAGGSVDNFSGKADDDRAIAGTIAHELGHGLCLSDSRVYFEQGPGCVFEGIDNDSGYPPVNNPDSFFNLEDYESVMNYRYQATNIDDLGSVEFSHGTNGADDHDDWSAVKGHVGAFNRDHTLYVEFGARGSEAIDSRPVSADGLIIAESIN